MKHTDILSDMTLREKAALLSGKTVFETWGFAHRGIPSLFLSDGPNGLRKQAGASDHLGLNASLPATCFPTASAMANAWNAALCEEVGEALGEEAAALGVHVLLGPGLNIQRSPLCGRNFEYFSEDPYLAGKLAAAYIRGVQRKGVGACPKHFAVNSQETRRMAMDAVVDERTLREIYLTGFEIAVREGAPRSIMTSYNRVNGEYAHENEYLLKTVLREDWGFDGLVVSDWGGSNDHVRSVALGADLEMPAPGFDSARQIVAAVEDGSIPIEAVDACIDRIIDAALTLASGRGAEKREIDAKAHHALARRAAAEAAVLLKNENDLLPLRPGAKVAVIGDHAFEPRYQGAGSSRIQPLLLDTVKEQIKDCPLDVIGFERGYARDGSANAELSKAALRLAAEAEVVLYFFGSDDLSDSEGLDRADLRIPAEQEKLLAALHSTGCRVVGVLACGSPVETPWLSQCDALLYTGLGGQAGAGAALDILTGACTPGGKLAETWPLRGEDVPASAYFPAPERTSEYREGLYVGYRYYATAGVRPRFPFGYGLSYTTFAYSDLQVTAEGARFTVENTGERPGAEIAQLYVSLPGAEVFRPALELKGFAKVFLQPGERGSLTIPFDDKTFRYWNAVTGRWEVEGGDYGIAIGASSEDIRLRASLRVEGTSAPQPYAGAPLPSYQSGRIAAVPDDEFRQLLGHPIPDGRWQGELSLNDPLSRLREGRSRLCRLVFGVIEKKKAQSEARGKPDLNILFIYNIPFRAIAKMTNGMVSMDMARALVRVGNGHVLSGLGGLCRGFFSNLRKNRAFERALERDARAKAGEGRKT